MRTSCTICISIMRTDLISVRKKLDPKSENEKCADQFASYFLAPHKSLRTVIKRIVGDSPLTMQHVIALEQYFGMSHLAMLWRLVSEGYLKEEMVDEYRSGGDIRGKKPRI